jgi:transposase-like protein
MAGPIIGWLRGLMKPIPYARHRFPPDVICHAVWLYFRFTLSFRDVEDLLAERGIEASYETIRCWTLKFGPMIACNLRRKRELAATTWRLNEMVLTIGGQRMYLWRLLITKARCSTCWCRSAVILRQH